MQNVVDRRLTRAERYAMIRYHDDQALNSLIVPEVMPQPG
jgi:hypothetical protein